jgi:hypothetical protein
VFCTFFSQDNNLKGAMDWLRQSGDQKKGLHYGTAATISIPDRVKKLQVQCGKCLARTLKVVLTHRISPDCCADDNLSFHEAGRKCCSQQSDVQLQFAPHRDPVSSCGLAAEAAVGNTDDLLLVLAHVLCVLPGNNGL